MLSLSSQTEASYKKPVGNIQQLCSSAVMLTNLCELDDLPAAEA